MTDAKLLQMFHEADKATQGTVVMLLENAVLGHFSLLKMIDIKGHTVEDVSAALGITPRTFKRKARTNEFTAGEMGTMARYLPLNKNEVMSIFFPEYRTTAA